jgi:hypothetical protein
VFDPALTSGPLGVSLAVAPVFDAIELGALLDVARMYGNRGIGHTQKMFGHNSSDFETIKVLRFDFSEDALQGVLNVSRSGRAEKHHLHFRRHEKEIPSGGMNFIVQSKSIETPDHAPVPEVRIALQRKSFGHVRRLFPD